MAQNKKIVVLYHGGCPDGFSGAWAAWKKLGNGAEYIGLIDRLKLPAGFRGETVYLIDWMYKELEMRKLLHSVRRLVVLDHHESAVEEIRSVPEHVYDQKHSGAVLAWRYFHSGKPTPKLLKFIEDNDLWAQKYKDTEAVSALIESLPQNFKTWSSLVADFENRRRFKNRLAEGQTILNYQARAIDHLISGAQHILFKGHRVLAVNSPVLRDKMGHLLARKQPPFGVLWWEEGKHLRISLRSVKGFSLLPLFKQFKAAGGHPNAGGIILPAGSKLPWKRVK